MLNKEEVERGLNGKTPYAVNIGEGMTSLISKNAHERIALLNLEREKLLPQYERDKTDYLEIKAAFDALQKQMDNIAEEVAQQDAIIVAMQSFKKAGKVQVNKTDVKIIHERFAGKKNISWLTEFQSVLRNHQKFMSPWEVMNLVAAKQHVKDAIQLNKKKVIDKSLIIQNILKHTALSYKAMGGQTMDVRFIPTIAEYKGKIGLYEWLEKGVPKDPKHMREFMFEKESVN
jgi:hypothetical protein